METFQSISILFGSYGSGNRIKLAYTRKIIDAIHSGTLLKANYTKTEVFGLEIPTEIQGVPSEILDPLNTVSCLPFNIFHNLSQYLSFSKNLILELINVIFELTVVRQECL